MILLPAKLTDGLGNVCTVYCIWSDVQNFRQIDTRVDIPLDCQGICRTLFW